MSFLIKDDELLEKCNGILKKKKKSLKAKIKSYNGKINTNFLRNKIPKEGPQYICWSVILLDSIFMTVKNYYPEVILEECILLKKERFISILLMM